MCGARLINVPRGCCTPELGAFSQLSSGLRITSVADFEAAYARAHHDFVCTMNIFSCYVLLQKYITRSNVPASRTGTPIFASLINRSIYIADKQVTMNNPSDYANQRPPLVPFFVDFFVICWY